jgi:aldehyde dehydrogenase (NAD+)
MYIDGEWRDSLSGGFDTVLNPATGEEIGRAPAGTATDVEHAVEAAERAYYQEWRDWDVRDIGTRLLKLANIVEDHYDELVKLETRENGKPLHEAENDLDGTVGALRYYGGAADKFHGDTVPKRNDSAVRTVRRCRYHHSVELAADARRRLPRTGPCVW